MPGNRQIWHAVFVYSLPLVLVWLGGGWPLAVALVLLALLTRWLISVAGLVAPERVPDVQLDSIAASHFAEKVRWCLDRLGIDYVEAPSAGALGAFTLGRTVPRLRFRTGAVRSSIGNSPEILRYLYGRYAAERPEAAGFLTPTPDRLALERDTDVIGRLLQRWVYYHIIDDRQLTLRAWGVSDRRTPLGQRLAIRMLYPLLRVFMRRTFRLTEDGHARNLVRLGEALEPFEERLADGRATLGGSAEPDFADFAFAAINGAWVQPAAYGGGAADSVRLASREMPAGMLHEIEILRQRFTGIVAFVERLYREERSAHV